MAYYEDIKTSDLSVKDFHNLSHTDDARRVHYITPKHPSEIEQSVVCKNTSFRFSVPTEELIKLKFEGKLEEHIQQVLKNELLKSLPDLKYTVNSYSHPGEYKEMTRVSAAIYIEDIK